MDADGGREALEARAAAKAPRARLREEEDPGPSLAYELVVAQDGAGLMHGDRAPSLGCFVSPGLETWPSLSSQTARMSLAERLARFVRAADTPPGSALGAPGEEGKALRHRFPKAGHLPALADGEEPKGGGSARVTSPV